MKKIFLMMMATVACAALLHANPLGLRSYQQEFSMTFATPEEAQAAEVAILPLPDGRELAFSARWDDTNPKHYRTHDVMMNNDIKGTFFELGPSWMPKKMREEYYPRLLDGGCSLGVHTMNHPFMNLEDANTIFWEFMRCRILIETESQTQVTTTVLPNSRWDDVTDARCALDIGAAIQATGLLGSPDVFYTYGEKWLGLQKGTLAMGFLLVPGDVNPNYELAHKQLNNFLQNPALADNPELSMAIHSNHTDEGLVNLDKIFASMAHNPKWWYCNQNEYAAYRYEFRHDKIEKSVNGSTAKFEVTRIEAAELGADVPLSLKVTGAAPTAMDGIEKAGDCYRLAHAAKFGAPALFGLAAEDGKCERIPELTARLAHTEKELWTLSLENAGAPLEDVNVTFRFGPAWKRQTVRCHQDTVIESAVFTASQEPMRSEERYKLGAPYYAAQIDFVQDGVRKRLYADLQEPMAPIVRSASPRDMARAWDVTDGGFDYAKLSVAGAPLPDKPEQKVNRNEIRFEVLSISRDEPGVPYKTTTAYVMEFKTASDATKARLCFSVVDEIWLNGQMLPKPKNYVVEAELQSGVNRIVLVHRRSHTALFAVQDPTTRQNIAEFLPLK